MKAETEIWQVLTQGEVYQADLPTLKQWIVDGLVQPADRVRKGNFKWIEAQRAPTLRRVFAGEELPPFDSPEASTEGPDENPSPDAPAHTCGLDAQALPEQAHALGFGAQVAAVAEVAKVSVGQDAQEFVDDDLAARGFIEVVVPGDEVFPAGEDGAEWVGQMDFVPPGLDSMCRNHPEQEATLVCRSCFVTLCRACPTKVGTSSVLLCPACGSFCDPLEGIKRREALFEFQSSGFGVSDFKTALAYPFKHLASLIGGALLYAFLLLGGMRTQLLASALAYGCISLVIHRVGYGNLKRDFLPDFSEFDFWDDVLRPCFLGLGVTLVTLGPTVLLIIALLLGWFGAGERAGSPLPPTPSQAAEQQAQEAVPDANTLVNGGTVEQEEALAKKVQGMRPSNQMARQIEESKEGDETALKVLGQLLARPGLIVLLVLAALAWSAFYHPMALLVAGWTESFKSVINPAVGLDTMRHMGMTYVKAFLMYAAVQVACFVVTSVVAVVTSPFDLPFVGNLPGTFMTGVVTFYASLVIACVLGLALFKSADRLGIELD